MVELKSDSRKEWTNRNAYEVLTLSGSLLEILFPFKEYSYLLPYSHWDFSLVIGNRLNNE
jgi:hypothetical protein